MTNNSDRHIATFRRVEMPGMDAPHWIAELYDREAGVMGDLPYPSAIAWLTEFSPPTGMGTILDFIMVPDHLRRCGYATRLIQACEGRWPDLTLTEAISEAGDGLLKSLETSNNLDDDGPGPVETGIRDDHGQPM
jgi:GNAT superfamily N-acetyltransferase